jgi:Phage tail assembly chaperone protein, TAC
MRLADDEITINLDHETIYLRPSLRAAFRLERRHGGFDKILLGIANGNFSIMADVIREGADPRSSFADFLDCIDALPLRLAIERISEPLAAFVLTLMKVERDTDGNAKAESIPMPFAEYHARLFRMAAGGLGWTPDQTWDATPAEIEEAYKGRVELLSAMFGSRKETDETITRPDENTRRELNAIGDLTNLTV